MKWYGVVTFTRQDNKKDKITKRRSFLAYRTILRLAFSAEVKNKQKGSTYLGAWNRSKRHCPWFSH